MSDDPRTNKVYKVIYGELTPDGEEQGRVDSTKVIARGVKEAMQLADKKIKATPGYFVEQVELITYLD